MKITTRTIIVIFAIAVTLSTSSNLSSQTHAFYRARQTPNKTLAERLGYSREARLLIVHADDLGMAHSINAATMKAFETGGVSSGSIMIPCPWLPEIAAFARSNPNADLGLHLTLTSEWKLFRWGSVLPKDRVSSLFDANGYLYPTESEAAAHINVKEAEAEIRAQIARAKLMGIQPTHLDSHMGTLYQTKELFEVLIRVGRENKLPMRIARAQFSSSPYLNNLIGPDDVVIDHVINIGPEVSAAEWKNHYLNEIKNLPAGVTEMVVHLAYDDQEMKAIAFEHPDWGSEWRQRDFDFVTSKEFRDALKAHNVKMITWRELGKLLR
ncbi:MAG TPA: polysaccharide deacetylase family protein [Pyrinomonadaceae bacterium]|nr:polysaccharide deacetylase family protein [Pyrinomonadaceae bacterium]